MARNVADLKVVMQCWWGDANNDDMRKVDTYVPKMGFDRTPVDLKRIRVGKLTTGEMMLYILYNNKLLRI